ncbi:MAG: hypothetical protein SGCHY_000190 [Lobulomycetales sp.]
MVKVKQPIGLCLIALAAVAVQAQECPVFEGCLVAIQEFRDSTCGPLSGRLEASLSVNCYAQCPGNRTVESQAPIVQQAAEQACEAVGLVPSSLPNPPPWSDLFNVTPSATTTAATAGPTTTAVVTGTTTTAVPAATSTPSSTSAATMAHSSAALVIASLLFLAFSSF